MVPSGIRGSLAAVVILVGLLVTRTQVGSSLVENVREVVRLEPQDPLIVESFDSLTSVSAPHGLVLSQGQPNFKLSR